jgi:serine/threonine protein kinase
MAQGTDDSKQTTASGLRSIAPESRGPTSSVAPAPARAPLSSRYGTGDLIADKYRLGRKLGAGGMGEVWLSHNETLDIDVAIKLIRGEVATEEMADRLLHEARAAARLGHPAIVRVNDFGKTNRGDPFIVMELLDGEDLGSALAKRGTLSPEKAVRTLLPIAHALTVAHNKGIVHRDLKPENIFVAKSDDGHIQPKLVDFGVAKLEKQHSHRITQSGALLGSPLYMSPEQARGDDVDHRADIWALGVVLYEVLTGRAPFEGKNYNAVLFSIMSNHPTPTVDLGVGDAELWALIERGLQKDPDRRWYSMRDFGEALARWLEDKGIHEDITGASLQTAWLQWKREEDALAGGSSNRPPPEEALGALPPVPHPALASSPEGRLREITVRRARPARRPGVLLAAGLGVAALLALILSLWSGRSPDKGRASSPTTAAREQPVTDVPAATGEQGQDPGPVDPAHERAIEEALAGANAAAAGPPSASAAPHGEQHAHNAVPGKPAPFTPAHGIYTADPYRSTPHAHSLKNPF